jgi:hypothetical protein
MQTKLPQRQYAFSILLFLLAVIFHFSLPAQTTAVSTTGTHDPTFLNQVYFWAPDSLLALEKTNGEMKMKMKALGFGGGASGYVLQGERSPVRIKAADNIRFAVKVSGMFDPSQMIKLYPLGPQKKTREATISSSGGMFNKTTKNNTSGIEYNVQKSGADVYILIPTSRLAPGEYGFMNMMQATSSGSGSQISYAFFAFGIDP